MKSEKIVISFIAVVIGVLAAALAFYFYESQKTIPLPKVKTITVSPPSPTQTPSLLLSLDQPSDEEVVSTKTLTISGKALNDSVIFVTDDIDDQIATPAPNGSFSTTITLDDGENTVEVTAISKDGQESTLTKTVTYSTEDF